MLHCCARAMSCNIGRRFNSSPPRQFGGKIADDIFKRIFFNENDWMSIKISLKFIPEGPIDNKSVLVQVMAWCRQATSHYLNQCWPSFLTHICGTRGRWVNEFHLETCRNLSISMISKVACPYVWMLADKQTIMLGALMGTLGRV